jgi:hypothetical protein
MRILVTIISVFLIHSAFAQNIQFYKQYSEQGYDYGQGVVQLEDSSYVVTGASSSFTGYQSQAFLLKVDSLGNFQWSNHYGGMESDWGRRVLYKQGFGFFIAGYTNSYGNGVYDYYLVKTDLNGQMEWEKTYGDYGWERVNDAALTRDTGVIMVGETSSNVTNHRDIYIVRTDKFGDTLWTKTIGGAGDDWAMSVKPYQDSNFMIVGSVYVEDSLKNRGIMLKLHEDGSELWRDTIHIPGNLEFNDFIIANDSIRVVGTHYHDNDSTDVVTLSYDIPNTNIFTLDTTNTDGDMKGMFIIERSGGLNDVNPYYIAYQLDTYWSYPDGDDAHVGWRNAGLWQIATSVQISHEGVDVQGQLINTSDGGYILVGYTSSDGMGAGNIFLCKVAPDNTAPTILDVTAVYNFVGAEEVEEIELFTVYPNPSDDWVKISTGLNEEASYTVIDLFGKEIFRGTMFNELDLDVSDLRSGVYLLDVQMPEGATSRRRIVVN